jgi:hypothetical protein
MVYDLKNEYEVPKFTEKVRALLREGALVELKKRYPNRSQSQNRYFYLILGWFACETGYSVDEVKIDIFKRLCNKAIFERETTNKRGKTVKYLRSSADLNTAEFTTAIERFRNYSAAQGIYIPSPNEGDFLMYIEKAMEQQKEYL